MPQEQMVTWLYRVLPITISFEGGNYGTVVGNFDGATLTVGCIGFTFRSGNGQRLLKTAQQRYPDLCRATAPHLFWGPDADNGPWNEWAASVTRPRKGWVEPTVRSELAQLLQAPEIKRLQDDMVFEVSGRLALVYGARAGMKTLRGLLMALDTTVQTGGLNPRARARYRETQDLVDLAHWLADHSPVAWRADILARRLCIATGRGLVHGHRYNLAVDFPTIPLDQEIVLVESAKV